MCDEDTNVHHDSDVEPRERRDSEEEEWEAVSNDENDHSCGAQRADDVLDDLKIRVRLLSDPKHACTHPRQNLIYNIRIPRKQIEDPECASATIA